ncbi:MAG: hypothetical protein ABFC73_14720, partial [Clostridiaceae bacterium]
MKTIHPNIIENDSSCSIESLFSSPTKPGLYCSYYILLYCKTQFHCGKCCCKKAKKRLLQASFPSESIIVVS